MAPGVSSTIDLHAGGLLQGADVATSRPMMRPLMSSLSMLNTLTEFSMAWLGGHALDGLHHDALGLLVGGELASSCTSLMWAMAAVRASSFRLSTRCLRASSAFMPLTFSKRSTCSGASSPPPRGGGPGLHLLMEVGLQAIDVLLLWDRLFCWSPSCFSRCLALSCSCWIFALRGCAHLVLVLVLSWRNFSLACTTFSFLMASPSASAS